MQMQSLSVHSTIGILRTHKSIDAFANADTDANAQWERNLSHQKIKCSFLDYVQLLMIGQVI